MKKLFTNKSTKIVFWVGISIILLGILIALGGGIWIELTYEDNPAANAVFIAGMVTMAAGTIVFCLIAVTKKRGEVQAQRTVIRSLPEDGYLLGGIRVDFTPEGLRFSEPDAAFTEYNSVVPYAEAKFYRTMRRKSPRDKGKDTVVVSIPSRYLGVYPEEEEYPDDGTEEGTACCETVCDDKLLASLKKYDVSVIDTRAERTEKPVLLKKFVQKNKRKALTVFIAIGATLAVIAGGIALGVWLTLSGALGENGAGLFGGIVGGVSAPLLCGLFAGAANAVRGDMRLLFYQNGVSFCVRNMHMFLSYGEIGEFQTTDLEDRRYIVIDFHYGSLLFPDIDGLYDYLREKFPEKCKGED